MLRLMEGEWKHNLHNFFMVQEKVVIKTEKGAGVTGRPSLL